MASGGINRRKEKRFNLKTIIVLTRETSSLNQIKGVTKDLSIGGAACLVPVYLDVFTMVNVKIFIDDNAPPIEVAGRVTWIKELKEEGSDKDFLDDDTKKEDREENKRYMLGIQFLNLYSKKKEILKNFLYGNKT